MSPFRLRPRSFFSLVLSAMFVVSLPLMLVLVASDLLMDRLVHDSAESIYRAATSSELSLNLQEKLTRQERHFRQYLVLGDGEIRQDLAAGGTEIMATIEKLQAMSQDHEVQALLGLLTNQQKKIAAALETNAGSWVVAINDEDFAAINDTGRQIYQMSQRGIYHEVETLQQEEYQAEKLLFALGSTCLPLTVILVFALTRWITRPIKQLNRGINILGQGDFATEIEVNGPDDLAFLGRRLNWLREKLAMYEQEKNKFASHISHELKTPLASIHEAAELLGDGVVGPVTERQREVIAILRKNCGVLKKLIENLVALTMAQAEKSCLQISDFDLEALVQEAITDHKPAIINNTLTLTTAIDHLPLRADRQRLKTAIDNLLSNAIKYTPSGGTITISGLSVDGHVRLDIHDSGPGIAEGERERIFSPFFQGSEANCRSHVKGTGLGLAIAREYVAAHNGSLELARLDEPGTCFRITLPQTC